MPIINSVVKGKQPVIEPLNVTPSTSAQQITAPTGIDGYSPVNVSAVTSSIDANIVAENIKSGVSILGVSGSVTELNGSTETVTPTTSQQTITPTSPSNGLTSVTVNAVTSAIDSNIVAGNIKKDVTILGVTGSLESGITPTGTKPITANGVYDVTDFASADVQVPTTAPAYYIEKTKDANNVLQNGSNTVINLMGVTDVGGYALQSAYSHNEIITGAIDLSSLTTLSGSNACQETFTVCTRITSVDLSSLTTVSDINAMNRCFSGCTSLTSVDLSSLTTVSGSNAMQYCFYGCTSLTSVDLSSLTTVSGSSAMNGCFSGCTSLTSVDLSSLTTVSDINAMNSCFSGCIRITSVGLSSLTTVSGSNAMNSCFSGCIGLISLSFPALTSTSFGSQKNQFNNMLSGVTGCTVHFPSNIQSTIGSWASVTAGFGGTNTTVLFDLPATNILNGADSVSYERNPKYDTATALSWRVKDSSVTTTPYYTSGLTDPTVGTTIYSDAACTTAVTTVDSIS